MITAKLNKRVETIASHIGMDGEAFVIQASISYLTQKKRSYLKERFEIISRYSALSAADLRSKIKDGQVPEHPAWEDMIETENIEAEIREIDNDIHALQKVTASGAEGV